MMIRPKKIGDELTLDEYNACQYLLYRMKCWNETIILDTYTPYEGKYAKYKLNKTSLLADEKQNTFRILNDTTETNTTLTINLTSIQEHIKPLHKDVQVTIYYKTPTTKKNANNTDTTYDADDPEEINQWSLQEAKPTPSLKDYTETQVTSTITDNKITFTLKDKKGKILPKGSLIKRRIKIEYTLNKEPYIDFRNGTANEMDEILIDNRTELIKLIENAPTDGTQTILRLDSNINPTRPAGQQSSEVLGQYFITKTITIQDGQNIEIRGGTNRNAIINGSIAKRCFIVKPGGRLTLNHITCEYGYAGKHYYEKGKGGAILVETSAHKYGILECNNCLFKHNTAWWGGAIYSYHTGLHLHKCTFQDNKAGYYGGAIEYLAKDVKITMQNMITTPGANVKLTCNVTNMNGNKVNEGEITFYLRENGKDTILGTLRLRNGETYTTIKAPEDKKTTDHLIVAKYSGGRATDNDVAMATLTVKTPDTFQTSWAKGNIVKAKIGQTITLNAIVQDVDGLINTTHIGQFKATDKNGNTKTILAGMNGNTYQLKYTLSKEDQTNYGDEFIFSFSLVPNKKEYTCNEITAKITIDVEKPTQKVDDYITGLFVNSNAFPNTTANARLTYWKTAGITDIYGRLADYTRDSDTQLLTTLSSTLKSENIRLHATINCFYDVYTKKWISPTNTTRMEFLKKEIDYIVTNYPTVQGICLDYMRYPGTSQNSTQHTNITNRFKELQTYIKSKNKNLIISCSVMPEDDASSLYYGQNYKEISEYVDYLQIMAYKGNYAINGTERADSWIVERANYAINTGIKENKIIISLQTYQNDNNTTKRSATELYNTAKALKQTNIKGISLFREGLTNNEYMGSSFKTIMEK